MYSAQLTRLLGKSLRFINCSVLSLWALVLDERAPTQDFVSKHNLTWCTCTKVSQQITITTKANCSMFAFWRSATPGGQGNLLKRLSLLDKTSCGSNLELNLGDYSSGERAGSQVTERLPIQIPLHLCLQLYPWARHLTPIAPHGSGRVLHGKIPLTGVRVCWTG